MNKLKQKLLNRPLMLEQNLFDGYRAEADHAEQMAFAAGHESYNHSFNVIEGVAIIPVIGLLLHREFYTHYYGITSYQYLAKQAMAAAMDADIKAILLDIDSGGGEVEGVFTFAEMIREVSETMKPVYGIANGAAFSAAYAIGVACEQLFVTKTGGVGSIGVVAEHVDISRMNEAMGLKITPVYAGDLKIERSPDFPISEAAVSRIQKEVDDSYNLFLNHVDEMNPNLSAEDARETQAGLFFGQDAIESNLANAILDFDGAIDFIIDSLDNSEMNQTGIMQTGETKPMKKLLKAKDHKTELKAEVETDEVIKEAELEASEDVKEDVQEEVKAEEKELEVKAEEKEAEEKDAEDEKAEDEKAEEHKEMEEPELDKAALVARHSEIMQLAIDAGQPALAPSLIERGVEIEDAKGELDKAAEINDICKRANYSNLADNFIKENLSVQDVRAKLFDVMVEASDASAVSNKPDVNAIDNEEIKGYTNGESKENPLLANAEKRNKS